MHDVTSHFALLRAPAVTFINLLQLQIYNGEFRHRTEKQFSLSVSYTEFDSLKLKPQEESIKLGCQWRLECL